MYFEADLKEKAAKFFRLALERFSFPPNDITIEVSTRCPQECQVCFREPLGVLPADMSEELFAAVTGRLKEAFGGKGPRYLNFVGLGEPFCNPGLYRMLRLAAQELPGTSLNVSTSLSVLDQAGFAALVEEGVVNRLSVSVDGLETGGAFHPFSERIRNNFAFLRSLKGRHPAFKLRVQTLITSRERVEAAVNFAADNGADEVQLMRVDLHAFAGRAPAARPPFKEERAIVKAARALARRRGLRARNNNSYNIFMDLASALDRRCLTTDDHVFIDAEGGVLPCFYLREVKFGSLAKGSLSEACGSARRLGFYAEQKALCRGCDIYRKKHCGRRDA